MTFGRRFVPASFAALLLSSTLTSCGIGSNTRRDPALRVGNLHVGERLGRLLHDYGRGTPAQWMDDRGDHVSVLLYRNGAAVLAAVVRDGRVDGIEAFQKMNVANVHNEFSFASDARPMPVHVDIARQAWLGAAVFSDTMPAVPPNWNVPTDFTIAKSGKSFYIVREGHAVSKTQSNDYGWILHLR